MQPGGVAVVVGGFAGGQAELPAVAGVADAHVGRRADRVADLVHALPLGEVGVGVHVDHEPALGEPQVPHGGADRGPHDAVGAVAAQHVLGVDLLRSVDEHPHPRSVLGHAGDLGAAAERDGAVLLEVGAQDRLEVGLVEHVRLGVAVPARTSAELGQHAHVAVQQP